MCCANTERKTFHFVCPRLVVVGKMAVVSLTLCVLVVAQGVVADKVYIVVPGHSASSCPGNQTECSLMYYAVHPQLYFNEDNTTFNFLHGDHHLVNSTLVLMANVTNLTLHGSTAGRARVVCSGEKSGGFSFYEINVLTITNLMLFNCSHKSANFSVLIALEVIRTSNLTLDNVIINNTAGVGLSLTDLHGDSVINKTKVDFSHNTTCCRGGNFAFYCSHNFVTDTATVHHVNVSNSFFRYGHNTLDTKSQSSGIMIEISCSANVEITFERVEVQENHDITGGNIFIDHVSFSNTWTVSISFLSCLIQGGIGNSGGGLCMFAIAGGAGENGTSSNTILNVENTHFKNNTAYYNGGAVYLRLHQNSPVALGKITFSKNCTFIHNRLVYPSKTSHGGIGVQIIVYTLPEYKHHKTIFFEVSFNNSIFYNNHLHQEGYSTMSVPRTGALYVENIRSLSIENSSFIDNNCSGIVGINSNFILSGRNNISGNRALKGGGIFFCAGSMIWFRNGSELNVVGNHASWHGGGIFVDGECSPAVQFCFFQVDNILADNSTLQKTRVNLIHNNASAGSALYGGLIDYCILYDVRGQRYNHSYPAIIFNLTFHIKHDPYDLSYISSDPMYVGFCKMNSSTTKLTLQDCPQETQVTAIPGKEFSVSAVIMGQHYGLVSGVVVAHCVEQTCIHKSDYSKYINTTVVSDRELTYTIYSKENRNVTLRLVAEDYFSGFPTYQYRPSNINIFVERCPLGFREINKSCECLPHISCSLTNMTVYRPYPHWIGYTDEISVKNARAIIIHSFCPLAYCLDKSVHIKTSIKHFDQDAQCAPHRTGLLCGKCRQNYSLGFGSSECLPDCNTAHRYLQYIRVIGLIAVCAVAGVLLVILLTLLNITVAEGTLNGLIFYANIVQVNIKLFFPPDTRTRPWTAFIAWLNLDFGISVCFYDGMDAYTKTWLQFILPLYLWFLAGGIIYFSRKSRRVSKLAGTNSVKVLATLFLLSFGKLFRTVIAAVFFTKVTSHLPNFMWLLDPNLHYLHGKHIVLFVGASVAGMVGLIYALTLTFIQCLRRSPNNRVFGWVQRLKPLLDAYTGPYKVKYHFWTGLLLLVRIGLFTAFALNFDNNPTLNFTLIITVSTLLITVTQMGIYHKNWMGLLDSSMYVNLIFFSAFTMLSMKSSTGAKTTVVFIFGVWALVTLVGIVCYHGYRHWFGNSAFEELQGMLRRRLRSQTTAIQPLLIGKGDTSGESDFSSEEDEREHGAIFHSSSVVPNLRETLIESIQ